MSHNDIIAFVTLIVAIAGAVFGFLAYRRGRTRIGIETKISTKYGSGNYSESIEVTVTNLNDHPITITEFFIGPRDKKITADNNLALGSLGNPPFRIEPRDFVVSSIGVCEARPLFKANRVIIKTACGRIFIKKGCAVREYIKLVKQCTEEAEKKRAAYFEAAQKRADAEFAASQRYSIDNRAPFR
ncbi:hypothetical protein [Ereboglobus luteus]|uniref:hypothetical protein n=1 Tax=Ereboglobus luteus TaxID=1796921 RepID=UPI0012603A27|nr:hypothetical protein [Ereboglobus luteus]